MQVVWFKRDLRTTDHAPLALAAARATPHCPLLALYIIEPSLLLAPDSSPRHYRWIRASLLELRRSLATLGITLAVRTGEAIPLLSRLHARHPISALWSHEETGNALTYARDLAVGQWCRDHAIPWTEIPQFGVIRRLKSRTGWAKRWEQFMSQPPAILPPAVSAITTITPGDIPTESQLNLPPDPCQFEQTPGEAAALNTLHSFLTSRGQTYSASISSPLTAATAGSRLSPYLAWGNLSLRTVLHHTRARLAELSTSPDDKLWRRSLRMFESRLHWHCHFIQKLESEPAIEFQNFSRAYDNLRPPDPDPLRFAAWTQGQTGYPLIDAVMRCLNATGWINFRMRAMVVSFSAYHLFQHWRQPALHLARTFIDYEPGIHFSQMQMQSGTTGINTLRIYSPTKQALDQDPHGTFIRRWVPELAHVPTPFIHDPSQMPPQIQFDAHCRIGTDYPAPIVDHLTATTQAKLALYSLRKQPHTQSQAQQIQSKHGSRKSGLAQVKPYRRTKKSPPPPTPASPTASLFD